MKRLHSPRESAAKQGHQLGDCKFDERRLAACFKLRR
jgi:hypothetical protein